MDANVAGAFFELLLDSSSSSSDEDDDIRGPLGNIFACSQLEYFMLSLED